MGKCVKNWSFSNFITVFLFFKSLQKRDCEISFNGLNKKLLFSPEKITEIFQRLHENSVLTPRNPLVPIKAEEFSLQIPGAEPKIILTK